MLHCGMVDVQTGTYVRSCDAGAVDYVAILQRWQSFKSQELHFCALPIRCVAKPFNQPALGHCHGAEIVTLAESR